jgi:hypothetical protein
VPAQIHPPVALIGGYNETYEPVPFTRPEEYDMSETTELKALTKNEVMVTLKGHVINRVPCCGYIRFNVADDGVTVKHQCKPWDVRIRRPREFLAEVPLTTKLAALAHAEALAATWVTTPEGAYALLHAEAEWRERQYVDANRELATAEQALKDAKIAVAAAKKEWALAVKRRRQLWDKQHPNYPEPEPEEKS